MAMTEEKYEQLVRRLETQARQNPGLYRVRVGLLAALGYAYVLALLILCLLIDRWEYLRLMNGGWSYNEGRLAIAVFALTLFVLYSLWVRFPKPEGIALTPPQSPRLFALVNELSQRLKAPRFHHILLDSDLNAAVWQVPRFGLFGGATNYLVVGLPILLALSPEEFRAVVAHEFGHLSGNHGKFGGWIYRVGQTWQRLLSSKGEKKKGDWVDKLIFTGFFQWYAPYFSAYSFALNRAQEYEADRCAAELTSGRVVAATLINVQMRARFLHEQIWKGVYAQATQAAEPPTGVFASLTATLPGPLPTDDAHAWLNEVFAARTDHTDTHPSLTDRLAALGQSPQPALPLDTLIPPPLETTAATYFLEGSLPDLTAQLESRWRTGLTPIWTVQHQQAQEDQAKLAELDARAESETLSPAEALQRAIWTQEYRDPQTALTMARDLVEMHPDSAEANYLLGDILLDAQEDAGIAYLEKAMTLDSASTLTVCNRLAKYRNRQGRFAEADTYQKRFKSQLEQETEAEAEREDVTKKDAFLPHALPTAETEAICRQIASFPRVKAALLVRKAVTHFPERPLYVLAVDFRYRWYQFHSEEKDAAMRDEIAQSVAFPGSTLVLIVGAQNRAMRRKLYAIPGAVIYQQARK